MKKLLVSLLTLATCTSAFATTMGVSTHPFSLNKHVVTTEFNSYLSDGAGMGISAKYLNRINDRLNYDVGAGFTDGDRSSVFNAGATYMIIPDYGRQPKVAIKGLLETAKIEDSRVNSFGIAPSVSKGFVMWGHEAYPFLALPVKVGLDTSERSYETATSVAVGMTGELSVTGIKGLVGNIETNFSLENSYTALVFGVSMPLQ